MQNSPNLALISEYPTLYWISGSPPSWRVMLGLLTKNTDYKSVQLDYSSGGNRSPEYLALNPKGQVPTFTHNGIIVRESIAILAYIEKVFDGPSLFGESIKEFTQVWQLLMEFENDLRPHITMIAQTLLRKDVSKKTDQLNLSVSVLLDWIELLENKNWGNDWLVSQNPSAVDCWLYPAFAWIERAVYKSEENYPKALNSMFQSNNKLTSWKQKVESLAGFENTFPPHWKDKV